MSELAVVESLETPVALPTVAPARHYGVLQGVLFLIAGIVILYVGLVPMGHVAGVIKVPVVLLSFVCMYLACVRAGKAIWGPAFDAGFWLCSFWLVALILATVFAGLLPLGIYKDTAKSIGSPGNLRPDLFSAHPLGTNNLSLDILSRSIYAARVSLSTALFAVALSMLVGGHDRHARRLLRGLARQRRSVSAPTRRSAIPALVLLIGIAAVLGVPKTVPQAILKEGAALAIVGIPTMIRLARANTLAFAKREFVVASRALGAKNRRILVKHLLPNVMLPIISYTFIIVAVLIVAEGSLAFLGLGLQQPQPTWGNMIAEGTLERSPAIPPHSSRPRRLHVPHRLQPQPGGRAGSAGLGPPAGQDLTVGERRSPFPRLGVLAALSAPRPGRRGAGHPPPSGPPGRRGRLRRSADQRTSRRRLEHPESPAGHRLAARCHAVGLGRALPAAPAAAHAGDRGRGGGLAGCPISRSGGSRCRRRRPPQSVRDARRLL